jgi:hypothetical protein
VDSRSIAQRVLISKCIWPFSAIFYILAGTAGIADSSEELQLLPVSL